MHIKQIVQNCVYDFMEIHYSRNIAEKEKLMSPQVTPLVAIVLYFVGVLENIVKVTL